MSARRAIALRGSRAETQAEAERLLAGLSDVLWVGPGGARPADVARLLGSAFDAVALDLHDGLDPDVLARAQGFVRGGGALVLRMPPEGPPAREALAVHPYGTADVGRRLVSRVILAIDALGDDRSPVGPVERRTRPTPDQDAAVRALLDAWRAPEPTRVALLADRGRGKSVALGRALAGLDPGVTAVVCAADDAALAELVAVAGPVAVRRPLELASDEARWDVLIVDEAARLPVPLLRRIHARHARAHQAWATTTGGYEGTGRGFSLRFLAGLERQGPVLRPRLDAPIRWDAGDPVEAAVRDALLLDAAPCEPVDGPWQTTALDRDRLASDPRLLSEVFGLLVHAHTRTTPSDLERLLDAPNLDVHAALADGRPIGVCLVAREGGLPAALCADLASGARRIRGHALADTLVVHAARPDAGPLTMVRSVRIATHPDARRRGVARSLVEHVHASYAPDLFGTMFGATAELVGFRHACGYALVRLGVSHGSRTGEPAAVMLRPVSARARALVGDLRTELARDLPVQLALLASDGEIAPDPALAASLALGLPSAEPLEPDRARAIVAQAAQGPRPFDCVVPAVAALLAHDPRAFDALPAAERALLVGRAVERRGWVELASAGGWQGVPAAMKALRRGLRAWAAGE